MNTVIGLFDNINHAERAAQKLIFNGFKADNVDISSDTSSSGKVTGGTEKKEGIKNFFKSLFGEGEEASNYSEVAERGCVVTVHTQTREEAELAASILDQYGALDANERVNYYRNNPDAADMGSDAYRSNRGTEGYTSETSIGTEDYNYDPNRSSNAYQTDMESELGDEDIDSPRTEASMPVIEEQMEVGKREVERDRVTIRSRIIEKPVEENLRLRVEHIYVDREPADRPATAADMETFKEGVIEARESEEVPVVKKEARVVEDIKLRKEVEERGKTIRESVKKQDVNVERKKKTKSPEKDKDDLI
jgi:stress response protein YsnF